MPHKYRSLKAHRAQYGLNQEFFAKLIGVAVSTYSLKENGESDYTLTEAKTIADYFGKTIEAVFFGQDAQNI